MSSQIMPGVASSGRRGPAFVPRRRIVLAALAALSMALAGCSAPSRPVKSPEQVSVRGVASYAGGPVAGVAVGFRANDCATCRLRSAVTNASGAYSIVLPAGDYTVLCAINGGTCVPVTADAADTELTEDATIDLTVGGGDTGGDTGGGNAGGDTVGSDQQPVVSGHVHDRAGQPVAGADMIVSPPDATGGYEVKTDASGYYAITADSTVPVGRVVCEYMPSPYAVCMPDTGHQVVFDPNLPSQTVDWTVTGMDKK
ncbi:MAG: carboxypeptidase-like regulatory domain-containing protein [Micropruina sp.]|uniref:carboxypeptidase-like regulatory domain-containing protein n=1 Tax=Micropruina sp. TaxID=2737536 RepID=UPI0039E6C854